VIRGLMTNEEWATIAPFLTTPSLRGGRPPANHRRVMDGILWICRTGAPWRDLPERWATGIRSGGSFAVGVSLGFGTFSCRAWRTVAACLTRCR